ncbi:putative quinol monooxygenase [Streptomyces sp. NPDC050560]|uniref:putative quinol monooxygenase n=1 Tax=Streptomyces sp. NPDC050560 TaxID=3365630 RepID=UPI0037BA9C6C
MPELQVIARYTVAEGRQEELFELLPRLAEASRAEPGNLGFTVYRELGNPRGVVLLERYASRDAFAAHRETPHFKQLVLERIVPLLDSRTVEQYEAAE